ncbi:MULTISPECIES: cupin domain-containing protein [Kitasatospora]|uniref:Cupin domain-containing protein n=1 Tax=Kitasatospora cystarginea TaxID=58350 RepID=A0ABP5RSS2_9ACTN
MKPIRWVDITPNLRRGGDLRAALASAVPDATSGFPDVLAFGPEQFVAGAGRPRAKDCRYVVLKLGPEEFVTEHYHPHAEEFVYVMEGEIVVRFDGEPMTVAACEGLRIPPGVRHRVENRSGRSAECVISLAPPAPHQALDHVDTETLPRSGEPAREAGAL